MMKKKIMISVLSVIMLSFLFSLYAHDNINNYNLDVFPNPMDSYATVSAFFMEKIPINVTLVDAEDMYVKTIYEGISDKGLMLMPFDRLDDKGADLPRGKYWIVLGADAKYTSTKKLLILK